MRTHLRSEIFILIMVVCFLQALLVGFAIWRINEDSLFRQEKDNLTQLLNVVNQDLESRVDSVNSLALDLVISNEIKSSLNQTTALEIGRAKNTVNSIISKRVISASATLQDISIVDMNKNTYSTRASYILPPDFRLTEREVFKNAQDANGALVWMKDNDIIEGYCWDTIFPSVRMGGLRAAAIIKDYTRGQVVGLLMISVKDDFFFGINYSNERLKSVNLFLISPDGLRVLPVAGSHGTYPAALIARVDTSKAKGTFVLPDTDKTVVSFIRNEAMGWTLVSAAATADIKRSFSFIVGTLVVSLFLSLFASLAISWWSTKILTRGVRELADGMRLVESGDFNVRIGSKRRDEIGWLSRSFDQMVSRIQELIEGTYKQQLLTQKAEFKALQAQINPHFLYNTLDMINWRLLASGETEISASIVRLGKILQYSMSTGAIVTLEEEIQNVEDYLSLRISNRDPEFSYSIDIEGGEAVRLPKLTLQPLVENAILHGFGRRRNGNELRIRSRADSAGVRVIEVSDNGAGMDAETVRAIMTAERGADETHEDRRMHIGVKNVDERLKYMYGADYGLEVSSEFGSGTSIRVRVPERGNLGPEDAA